jgi:hypothetical protein
MRAATVQLLGEAIHIKVKIIFKNIPNLILYTPAPQVNRCDQFDKADARNQQESDSLFAAITMDRISWKYTIHQTKITNKYRSELCPL